MFWTMTFKRLTGSVTNALPRTYGARPDLEKGNRLLAVATEAGILLTLSGPPESQAEQAAGPASTTRFRSTVNAPAS